MVTGWPTLTSGACRSNTSASTHTSSSTPMDISVVPGVTKNPSRIFRLSTTPPWGAKKVMFW